MEEQRWKQVERGRGGFYSELLPAQVSLAKARHWDLHGLHIPPGLMSEPKNPQIEMES